VAVASNGRHHGIDEHRGEVWDISSDIQQPAHVGRRVELTLAAICERHTIDAIDVVLDVGAGDQQAGMDRDRPVILGRPDQHVANRASAAIGPGAPARDRRQNAIGQRALADTFLATEDRQHPARQPLAPQPINPLRSEAAGAFDNRHAGLLLVCLDRCGAARVQILLPLLECGSPLVAWCGSVPSVLTGDAMQ